MPHILIVEDEFSIAETIVYALETEHFQTTHVTTGAEAIELVPKHTYALVVLDIGLPDQTGLDVCQKIRTESNVPILFLTAVSSNQTHSETGISINTQAMTIHCYGKPVDLTAHEYKLLATFLSQPGRTFTREQLLEHAWDDPGSAMDRTVDAHIKTLRAKLTEASSHCNQVIQTRRGLGYCYHPPTE